MTKAENVWRNTVRNRQLALEIFLEGVGVRAIGWLLKVSNTAVLGWVKKASKSDEMIKVGGITPFTPHQSLTSK